MANKEASPKIKKVRDLLEEVERILPGRGALYRGQPVDKPLLPKVARGEEELDLTMQETDFLAVFRRRAWPFVDVDGLTDWQLLAIAQHWGAPTRLLDWTENALAALWFSLIGFDTKSADQPVVWVLTPHEADFYDDHEKGSTPFDLRRTRLYRPDHVSSRITAQHSVLSAHKYWEKGHYLALEKQSKYRDRLTKVMVDGSRRNYLLEELDRLGINNATMYPDLMGLCQYLAARHEIVSKNQLIANHLQGPKMSAHLKP